MKGADGSVGPPGAPGAAGSSPIAVSLSATLIVVAATSANVTKANQLPRTSTVTVKQGDTDVTSSSTFALATSSDDITASVSGNTVSITGANSAGYVDVTATFGGVAQPAKRIEIGRQADAPPPATGSSNGSGSVTQASLSASYGAPADGYATVRANASGQIGFSCGATYYAEQPFSGSRSYRPACAPAYRAAGGGSWSYGAETQGSLATSPSTSDPIAGSLSISGQVVSGLTPGAFYDIGPVLRKAAGSSQGPEISGSWSVQA